MPEVLFSLVTILPLPIWVSMLLFPKASLTQRLVMSYWPVIALCGLYALALLGTLATGAGLDLSYAGVQATLSGRWGVAAVWAHLMTLNLLSGGWIFRDAKYWGVKPEVFLLLTLFAGPLGLGAYLFVRERRAKVDPVRSVN
ncbi:ABA4-like family protein [soil metagenome]